MGDEYAEMWMRLDAEKYSNLFLGKRRLDLDDDTISWILNDHIDCFVSQSQGNESVKEVVLYSYSYSVNDHDYEILDKVGKAIGNLQALKTLRIANHDYREDDEDLPILDLKILARILSHVRQNITIDITTWNAEESRLFARAIHGHPTITSCQVGRNFPHESLDALYSALATLPALESAELSAPPEEEIALTRPESLADLLRVPTLQSVSLMISISHLLFFNRWRVH